MKRDEKTVLRKDTRAELESQLKLIEAAEKAEREAALAERNEAWDKVPDIYKVTPQTYHRWIKGGDIEGAMVLRGPDPVALAEYEAKWGSRGEDARFVGMFYYRTDENILTHEGGGTYVLQTPKLCNGAEWASILAGDIPEKFIWRPNGL